MRSPRTRSGPAATPARALGSTGGYRRTRWSRWSPRLADQTCHPPLTPRARTFEHGPASRRIPSGVPKLDAALARLPENSDPDPQRREPAISIPGTARGARRHAAHRGPRSRPRKCTARRRQSRHKAPRSGPSRAAPPLARASVDGPRGARLARRPSRRRSGPGTGRPRTERWEATSLPSAASQS